MKRNTYCTSVLQQVMADNVLHVFEVTSLKSQDLLKDFNEQCDYFFTYLDNVVEVAKELLDKDDASVSSSYIEQKKSLPPVTSSSLRTPPRSNSTNTLTEDNSKEITSSGPKKAKTQSNGKISTKNSLPASPKDDICQIKTPVNGTTFVLPAPEVTRTLRKLPLLNEPEDNKENAQNSSICTPIKAKASKKKSCGSDSSAGGRGSVRLLASTKASKHRSQLNHSITPCGKKSTLTRGKDIHTPNTHGKKGIILRSASSKESVTTQPAPPPATLPYKSKLRTLSHEKVTAQKSDRDEAVAKKFALMKLKVEEHKKKRELKVEKNLQARELIKKEKEERLKKLELKEKAIDKKQQKTQQELKHKRKLTNRSDDEVPNAGSMKKVAKTKGALPLKHANEPKLPATSTPILETKGTLPLKHANEPKLPATSTPIREAPVTNPTDLNVTYVSANSNSAQEKIPEKEVSTPTMHEVSAYQNYEISQLRNSDDSDDDCAPTKRVPKWASGLCLKEALLTFNHNPPNIRALFGKICFPPDEMFGLKKKKNVIRSSSAIWCSPENSFLNT